MIARIRELLLNTPFRSFIIHTSGGRKYRIPTVDHANVSPKGTLVNIWFDDDNDGGVTLSALHITAVEVEGRPRRLNSGGSPGQPRPGEPWFAFFP